MIWKLRAPGETNTSSSGTNEAWPLTCECPSSITALRNSSELNRIHWQSPIWGSSEWTKLSGLNHCQNVRCPNLAKKESFLTRLKVLSNTQTYLNGMPITRFRKHYSLTPSLQSRYWGLGCSSMVEFLPSMQTALGSVPSPVKKKLCSWQCLGEPVNTVTWRPCLHDWNHRVLFVHRRGHKCPLCPDLIAERRWNGRQSPGQQLARSFVKVAGRNLSLLPLTAFKATRKASRMSAMNKRSLGSSRAHVLAVLSDCHLQPQARKWPPTQIPKERKQTEECILLPCPLSANGPCQHHVLSAPHSSVSRGHALSPRHRRWPLEPSTGVLSVPRSFISRWMLRPVLKGKLQIALRTSLSFP